jgi:hypothetical protein
MTQPVYRFKFAPDFQAVLESFADTHRFDEISVFRESWERWYQMNMSVVNEEEERLKRCGYKSDIKDKIYKSVRYYFKNKSSEKKEVKKRKVYVSLERKFLEDMSRHISEFAAPENYKPAHGYNHFLGSSEYNQRMGEEKERLMEEYQMSECDVEKKIKKTYKNRYFLHQKRVNNTI